MTVSRPSRSRMTRRREAGSERSVEQTCELMNKNRIEGVSVGRAGRVSRSPDPSRAQNVDSAAVYGTRSALPRGICLVHDFVTEDIARWFDLLQEVSRGHVIPTRLDDGPNRDRE